MADEPVIAAATNFVNFQDTSADPAAAVRTRSDAAARKAYDRLKADPRFLTAFAPELDIVVWAVKASSVSEASVLARRIFNEAEERHLHLAVAELPVELFDVAAVDMERDRTTITCLRSVLMKPAHRDWVDRIWDILDDSTKEVSIQENW